jgi:opacity protein-like surface antigen
MLLTAIMLLGLLGVASATMAADLPSKLTTTQYVDAPRTWTGAYVGVFGTCGTGAHVLDADVGEDASVHADGLSFRGCGGGVQAGADYQVGSVVIGVGADYEISTAKTSASLTIDQETYRMTYQKEDSWTVFARLGYLVGPNTLLYGLGGYGNVNFGDVEWTGGSIPGLSHTAWTVGTGIEHRIGRASLKVEYRHRMYSEEILANVLKDAPVEDAVILGISFRM